MRIMIEIIKIIEELGETATLCQKSDTTQHYTVSGKFIYYTGSAVYPPACSALAGMGYFIWALFSSAT
jgi:hypothetical protein